MKILKIVNENCAAYYFRACLLGEITNGIGLLMSFTCILNNNLLHHGSVNPHHVGWLPKIDFIV